MRDRKVAVHGWQSQTEMDIMQLLERLQHLEIRHVSVTDIERDGEMNGPAFDLYRDIRKQFPNVNLVATGGISSVADLENLQALGCHGAVVGKAFFEGEIPLQYFKIHSKI